MILPYFCQKFFNGSKKKIQRIILVFVSFINSGIITRHYWALGIFNPDHSFCDYFFRTGDGYYLSNEIH